MTITINTYNDANQYWNDGSTEENAKTLLHELGHAYNFLSGSGGFAISNVSELGDDYAFDKIIDEKRFSTIVIVSALLWAPVMSADQNFSVCELLKRVDQLTGKAVVVTGIARSSAGSGSDLHFDELVGINCSDSPEQDVIRMVYPDVHFLTNPPVEYKPDSASIRKAERDLDALLKRDSGIKAIKARVTGIVYRPASATEKEAGSRVRRHKRYRAYLVIAGIELQKADPDPK